MQKAHSETAHAGHGSWWPPILGLGTGFLPFGFVVFSWGSRPAGVILLSAGSLIALFAMSGWVHSVIREKYAVAYDVDEYDWLKNGMKMFLISEAMIFGAFFAHHFYTRVHFDIWPPAGSPHLETRLPAVATLLLVFSSFTMEWAHKALIKGRRLAAQRWVLFSFLLGAVFLSIQGYEWGHLHEFDQFVHNKGVFGSLFYSMTGFHGLHVSVGLVLLASCWVRLKLGHFSSGRHFGFLASSWYWHFVDIVWVFLFTTIYLL